MKKDKAFTLLELMIVVIVVGMLALLATPRLMQQMEGARATEAIQALSTFYAAQQRYALDHGACTATCSDLDVDLTLSLFSITCAVDCSVRATRAGSYRLDVSSANVYSCTNIAGTPCTGLNKYLP